VHDDQQPAYAGARLRREQEERDDELEDVVAEHLEAMQGSRQVVEVPAQRVGHRLGLVVVVGAGEIPPAPVAPDLDEPGAELEPEEQPAEQPQDDGRRRLVGRAEEDREEARVEQQRLPSEGVEDLAHVHRLPLRPVPGAGAGKARRRPGPPPSRPRARSIRPLGGRRSARRDRRDLDRSGRVGGGHPSWLGPAGTRASPGRARRHRPVSCGPGGGGPRPRPRRSRCRC
jgi:hypothetical protein